MAFQAESGQTFSVACIETVVKDDSPHRFDRAEIGGDSNRFEKPEYSFHQDQTASASASSSRYCCDFDAYIVKDEEELRMDGLPLMSHHLNRDEIAQSCLKSGANIPQDWSQETNIECKCAMPTAKGNHSEAQLHHPRSLSELVSALEDELQAQSVRGGRDVASVQSLMESFDASLGDWKTFEFYDTRRYTRNLISTDGKTFTLMLLCWGGGHKSAIHDHAGSECWLRVVKGQAVEEMYDTPEVEDDPLQLRFSKRHDAGAVCFINDSVGLHRIANASDTEELVTLHCYSPPFDECKAFIDGTGRALPCKVNFHSEAGQLSTP
jgi:cysteine dioxygenase